MCVCVYTYIYFIIYTIHSMYFIIYTMYIVNAYVYIFFPGENIDRFHHLDHIIYFSNYDTSESERECSQLLC